VLGDAHVDRALAQADEFSGDFQEFITRYAWGEIWDRPGLDRRSRSCVTLTALVAGGHLDELAFHTRAALRNGLTPVEIKEVLLQAAVYCGVPAANSAFKVAQQVIREETTPRNDLRTGWSDLQPGTESTSAPARTRAGSGRMDP
jgi:3-oxoadipate enol-lactonase/4-carboxymuconolactone decarboxylase